MQTIFFNYHKALAKNIEIQTGPVLVMGENITKASRIGGLGKIDSAEFTSLEYLKKIHVMNVPNCELTHVGFGLGNALNGIPSFLMVKQLDFLALALDHFLNSHWQLANCERYSPYDCCVITFSVDIEDQGPQSSFCGPLEVLPGHFVDLYFPITQQEFEYCFSLRARAHLKMIIISQENYKKILPDKLCIETSENGYTKFYFDASKNSKTALIAYGCTAAEVSVNLESINVVFFNLFAPRRLKIEALAELLNCFDKVIIADVSGCDEFAFGLAGKLALARPQLQSKFKMMVQSTNYSGVGRRPRFMEMYAHTTQ